MASRSPVTAASIEAWIIGRLAEEYGLNPAAVDPAAPFESLGLASREVVMLSGDLEEWLGRTLSPVLLYEYPSIRALSEHLAQDGAPKPHPVVDSPALPLGNEPIAIVGLGARFPGAADVEAFWQALVEGRDCISRAPAGRWDAEQTAAELAGKKPLPAWGGFLERVDEFDAAFFGISGREAVHLDPQQRLLLEVTWEALADAGLPTASLAGQAVGVYVGISSSEYGQAQMGRLDQINSYSGTGSALSIAANRLSYYFDWRGPSVAVDTACSSSLVAVHMACRSLCAGEAKVAVAAGANLILSPAVTVNFNEAGAMAADGRCKAFDARADGYVRGEGVGVVVLKPLAQAQADGDRIYAVILGSAVNQDGRTNGLMAPNPRSQEDVLRAAYREAGVRPVDVAYVEAHGTGTLLGDPIEAKALAAVRQEDDGYSSALPPLRIGSVKTNVGHLEAAAGVAGLIKVAQAIHRGQMPPSLHFETPNPHIPFETLPLRVQTQLEAWPPPGQRPNAGVSSFGFGGTNAHVVLGAESEARPRAAVHPSAEEAAAPLIEAPAQTQRIRSEARLLLLSARTSEALRDVAGRWRSWLELDVDFEAACYTAARRQTHLEHRLALVASSAAEAREVLAKFLAGEPDARLELGEAASGRAVKVVFVCPGQGAQWPGMARGLLNAQPAFRQSLEQTNLALRAYVDWDLMEVLLAPELTERIDVIQPVLFAVSVALAAAWRACGVTPDVVIGHSLGEVAAAHIAGALSLEDACRVICGRSQLLREISGGGLMAVVELTEAEARARLAGREAQVAIAAVNGPRSIVLSGSPAAVEAVLAELEAQGVFCRRVKVDVASHSPQVDGLQAALLQRLASIQPRAVHVPVHSTVIGQPLAGPEMDAAYWFSNLRQPVQFAKVVDWLQADGPCAFVELSPHPVLLAAIGAAREGNRQPPVLAASMRRETDEPRTLLAGLGRLHVHGCPVDWAAMWPAPRPVLSLPHYPWQRERYWFEPPSRPALTGGEAAHPMLAVRMELSTAGPMQVWQGVLSAQRLPFLNDHRVRGQVIFPAAGFIEMALAGAAHYAAGRTHTLSNLVFSEALALPAGAAPPVQLVITTEEPHQAGLHIASAGADGPGWTRHAQGLIRLEAAAPEWPHPLAPLVQMQARLGAPVPASTLYADLADRGLNYGPAFQRLAEVWRGEGEALARLEPIDGAGQYRLHPAVLDGAFQSLAAALPGDFAAATAGRLFLPVAVETVYLARQPQPQASLYCHAHLRGAATATEDIKGDLLLLDEEARIVALVLGLRLRAAAERRLPPEDQAISQWFYRLAWEERPLEASTNAARLGHWLLLMEPGSWQFGLVDEIAALGGQCTVVTPATAFTQTDARHYELSPASPKQFQQLVSTLGERAPEGIIYGWGQGADAAAQADAVIGGLHLAQALAGAGWREAPRLYALAEGLGGAAISGLWRTMGHEQPEFRCTIIEFAASEQAGKAGFVAQECLARSPETEVRMAGGRRQVARLLPHRPAAARHGPHGMDRQAGQPRCLVAGQPGLLDSLHLVGAERRSPAAGEIEIAVEAAGLNFLDVLSALGSGPDQFGAESGLGFECAGRVTAVGAGVDGLRIGDDAIALAPGALADFVVTPAALAARKPPLLDWDAAATIPIAFLTAYHALKHVAQVRPGERVLIHSAASGTGLAAVQVARWLGAEIVGTAGSEGRRAYLRELGLAHVFDSRTLAFADEAQALGGVDVVLNSLAGEAIPAALAVLRPRGRFLELGKRDIAAHRQVGLYALRRNLSFSVVDLAGLAQEAPGYVAQLLAEVLPLFEAQTLQPLPYETHPLAEAALAFRRLAQAQHSGKVVLRPTAQPAQGAGGQRGSAGIRADGAYLLTGGLGAIGRRVAAYLVEQGARRLVLLGRGAPSPEAQADIAALEATGAVVEVVQAEVASLEELRAVFERFEPRPSTPIRSEAARPPLYGIFHLAGVLDDGIMLQQTASRFESVLAPKLAGSWNLHVLAADHPVEVFVLFSSAAALLGSPAQASYAAGNAFMDALARWRREQGLPALSLQWGPWAEIGLAAGQERAGRLSQRGFEAIAPAQGVRALHWALAEPDPILAILPFDARQWRQSYPQAAGWPLLSALGAEAGPEARQGGGALREALLVASSPSERYTLLETHLRQEMAEVLRISPSRIGPEAALDRLGFDSLLALELRNRLELSLGVRLSATMIWNYPTLPALVAHLAAVIGDAAPAVPASLSPTPASPAPNTQETDAALVREVNSLSDEDALRELWGA